MSKLCVCKLCVSKLCVCVSQLCVDNLCVNKLCVCVWVSCVWVSCMWVSCVFVSCVCASCVWVSCVCVCKLCVSKLCLYASCVWASCVWGGGDGSGRRTGCRTKNKNPTQRCGESKGERVQRSAHSAYSTQCAFFCALCILTWKCASRHNGVHFFDISTATGGPNLVCFVHFDLEMCFVPQRRALFHLSSGQLAPHPPLWRAYFSTLRSPKSLEKHSVSRLSYLFSHLHLISSYSFSSTLLSSNLSLLSASSLLCFSSVHIVGSLTSKLPSISFKNHCNTNIELFSGARPQNNEIIKFNYWKLWWCQTWTFSRRTASRYDFYELIRLNAGASIFVLSSYRIPCCLAPLGEVGVEAPRPR